MSSFYNHNIHNYKNQEGNPSEEGIVQMTVASRVGRHTKCGNTIIKMLLRLIIEAKFHVKHVIGDSTRKASLGSNLHAEFCINPNMICFADTSAGHQFSLKYRDLKCVKERF
ncbi:hypothetical protein PHYBLDRAFT_146476 [Phycomyces blakesleeanus NRRL 1555(-)]|uniref:Uncharacterized protein n=1 Tax=Phycomyces blakesleeanus (strain ATCC 8743b / DSM 1359 / FGSC 10004 / NBRC 33097 / NRRL 1555) TaxID=763407 RepID=A0A167MAC5_PHYB8|nr:hypothetical protein PHYBLDRAFT_146476 [Phycomyces blakesleeanus NRRL 1555(-)]OAD72274.1 hypothetical protein PHYBLDRAFT_146476 [Phycomyces blakesleeanus NRRL 1555(-)]|eukprot:XP_018290314.1 hypothetical protein PHYBLDRAFT_146476 [Phycomyces blakesleeanus NRRL 1555(-)]